MLSPEKTSSGRVMYALIFDEASGEDSLDKIQGVLGDRAKSVVGVHWELPKRVNGEDLVTDEERRAVIEGIADAVETIANANPGEVIDFTSTCNTASLPYFMKGVFSELENRAISPERYRFHSFLDVVAQNNQTETITFGTRALCQGLASGDSVLKTPFTYKPSEGIEFPNENREEMTRLFQELIWREKKKDGSDVSGAPPYPNFDGEANNAEIRTKMGLVLEAFEKLGVKKINLACTEAPLLFAGWEKELEAADIDLIDPSKLLGQKWAEVTRAGKT